MNPRPASQLHRILYEAHPRAELVNAKPLRVAARMLSRSSADEMTATTVVGALGPDGIDAFRGLVQAIADDYQLTATITFHVGSFSVRFDRRQ